MSDQRIRSIAIVVGRHRGLEAAASLSRFLTGLGCQIRPIESAGMGTLGIGAATFPPIMDCICVPASTDAHGRILREDTGCFLQYSWLPVMPGRP